MYTDELHKKRVQKLLYFPKENRGVGCGGGYMTRIGRTCRKEKFIVQLVAIIFHLVLCAGCNLLPCSHMQ